MTLLNVYRTFEKVLIKLDVKPEMIQSFLIMTTIMQITVNNPNISNISVKDEIDHKQTETTHIRLR